MAARDRHPEEVPTSTLEAEIARLRRAEAGQALLLGMGDRLRDAGDPHMVMALASELLARYFSASRVGYAEVDADSGWARVADDWRAEGMSSIAGPHQLNSYGPEFAADYHAGISVVIDDFEADPRSTGRSAAEAHARLNIRAQIVVPLIKDSRLTALLFVHSETPRAWTAEDVALVREVAERTWTAVERARAEEALRRSQAELERQRRLYEAILTNTPDLAYVFDLNHRFTYANDVLLRMWGRSWDDAIGKNCLELGYPDWHAAMHDREIEQVIATKQPIRGEVPFAGTFGRRIYDYIFVPVLGADGEVEAIAGTTRDVTERKQDESRQALRNRMLELAIEDRPLGEILDALIRAVEVEAPSEMLGSVLLLDRDGTHLRHGAGPSLPEAYNAAIDGIKIGPAVGSCGTAAYNGAPVYVSDIESHPLWADFRELALSHELRACWSTPIISGQGAVLGTFAMYYREPREPSQTDIDLVNFVARSAALVIERKRAEEALRDETHTLEVLNRVGASLSAQLDLDSIVQKVTDAATELSGAAFGAFFYNIVDQHGESYTLYTISGVPREAFSKFPMPRNTEIFAPTFNGVGIIRSDDITKDPRYGRNAPHTGMPEGHLPVRSYLAVPVVSRVGEVIGGLFFGHPEAGVFTARAERIVAGIAAQSAIAVDNARLYDDAQKEITARASAEERLRQLNGSLERLVEERTAALLREVEERRRAEEALRQGEKLQAIGELTGGIAHDFNNILQVVSGGATLLQRPGLTDQRRDIILDGMIKATQSAKDLTNRLLAFARKQSLNPEPFDLNSRLFGMSELLRHTLGSRIHVETDFAPEVWPVMVDPSQLEVAILNLAVNARDAMLPEGGVLRLRTRAVHLEATSEHASGDYVSLAISDTGKGMTPAILARAFEPFFTTKGPTKGTGLGLAQVYGFVRQSGGNTLIDSTPGQGTTITLHLPRAASPPAVEKASRDEAETHPFEWASERTVLVVDDNPDVAAFAVSMVESLGYRTKCAANAAAALAILEAGEKVDAVFSDVVMPGNINGVQLADILRLRYPEIATVLASGYSQVLIEWDGRAAAEVLGKPYRLDELAAALARAIRSKQTMAG